MSGMSNHVIICGFGRVGELIGQVRRGWTDACGQRDAVPKLIQFEPAGAAPARVARHTASAAPRLEPGSRRTPCPPARQMLSERLIPFVALDVSASRVQDGKRLDLPVYFGDAGSPAVLHAVGAENAACAVRRPAGEGCAHACALACEGCEAGRCRGTRLWRAACGLRRCVL